MASPELEAGEAVIPLVLRRSQLPLGTVCQLLCSSSTTAAAVHNSCAGTIELQLTSKAVDLTDFIKWLSKHAVLLRSVEEHVLFDNAAAAAGIAAALSRAAALPDGSKLRSLQTSSLSVVKTTAGSCSSLTCLELVLSKDTLFPTAKEAIACIAGLSSQLSSLTLHASFTTFDSTDGSAMCHNGQRTTTPGCGLHYLLAECLPQLTALTRLAIDEFADTANLKHAPPQLLELEAMGVDDQCTNALELGHLSSCTWLVLPRNPEYELEGWRDVKENDTLPPNLQWLSITDCRSATPLLALTKLTGLVIAGHCHMPVAELQRLSSLTRLEHVHLGYNVYRGGFLDDAAEEDSPGWGFVPALKVLELRRMIVVDAVQHLSACTNLTRLVWEETYIPGRVYRDGGLGALSLAGTTCKPS